MKPSKKEIPAGPWLRHTLAHQEAEPDEAPEEKRCRHCREPKSECYCEDYEPKGDFI